MTTALQTQTDVDRQIAEIKTAPEANDLRKKIKAVQALAPKRHESYEIAFNGGRSFCEVSAKAGKLWAEVENKAARGNYSKSENFQNSISVTDAGFGDAHDAMVCERLSELTPEEREAYYLKVHNDKKVPTLGGLYSAWRVKNNKQSSAPFPEGKFRVIYADPPWQYGDRQHTDGDDSTLGGQDIVLESHYKTMSLQAICDLPVMEHANDNAVLFLWVTSPMLDVSFEIVRAWGFEYKTSFVWDKIKHNVGNYNSVRHEFLLVCTRGKCLPDKRPEGEPQLIDSVQSIERGEHSAKPKEFRSIIDYLYPNGPRIELFARGQLPDNWQAWGKECQETPG